MVSHDLFILHILPSNRPCAITSCQQNSKVSRPWVNSGVTTHSDRKVCQQIYDKLNVTQGQTRPLAESLRARESGNVRE